MQTLNLLKKKTMRGGSQPLVGIECPVELERQTGMTTALTDLPLIQLIPEGFFFGKRSAFLREVAHAGTPVIGHSVEMSIGSADGFKTEHFERILAVLAEVNCVYYSDHLCMTGADGIGIGQLTTLPFSRAAQEAACRNIDKIQARIRVPFLIENITNRFVVPGQDLSETEFINGITKRTGCGLLVDLTNLYINSVNFHFDPYQWLNEIDSHAIRGVHLAGGEWEDDLLYDTHSQPVHPEVWDLLRHVVARGGLEFAVVEWDQQCPPLARLLAETAKASAIFSQRYTENFAEHLLEEVLA